MRAWQITLGLTLLLLSSWAQADKASESSVPQRLTLMRAGAQYQFLASTVELPTERYALVALYDFDNAYDKESSDAARPKVLSAAEPPPLRWMTRSGEQANFATGAAPLASKEGTQSCHCTTVVSDSSKERVAALYARHSFQVAPALDLSRYQLIELRVSFRDGLHAYLNGTKIASRNLRPSESATATRGRGPEWERFLVTLKPGMLKLGENVLSFEVRPAAHASGVRLDAELALLSAGHVVRGPMLQRVGSQSAVLVLDTDVPTQASVAYGETASLGKLAHSAGGGLARHHRFDLENLKAGAAVYYQVNVAGSASVLERFNVPPSASEPLRFAVYGDMRGGHRVHGQIVESLLDEAIDFVVVTGDLVLRGSDEGDWQRFFAVAKPLLARLPFYPVAGNHDMGRTGDERRRMNEIFSLWPGPKQRPAQGHWYSFDISGVHFVMLDSNRYRSAAQRVWLDEDLAKARRSGARAIFAAVHAGPYSRGLHLGHSYAAENYAPILAKYKVSLLFAGHDHLYQRGRVKGLNYMVSGGAGAPLYSVRCGIKGKKRCKTNDGMQHVAKEHHYILVTVYPRFVEACPKRVDKTPLEACIRYPL